MKYLFVLVAVLLWAGTAGADGRYTKTWADGLTYHCNGTAGRCFPVERTVTIGCLPIDLIYINGACVPRPESCLAKMEAAMKTMEPYTEPLKMRDTYTMQTPEFKKYMEEWREASKIWDMVKRDCWAK